MTTSFYPTYSMLPTELERHLYQSDSTQAEIPPAPAQVYRITMPGGPAIVEVSYEEIAELVEARSKRHRMKLLQSLREGVRPTLSGSVVAESSLSHYEQTVKLFLFVGASTVILWIINLVCVLH